MENAARTIVLSANSAFALVAPMSLTERRASNCLRLVISSFLEMEFSVGRVVARRRLLKFKYGTYGGT